jgi:hypothetical protein
MTDSDVREDEVNDDDGASDAMRALIKRSLSVEALAREPPRLLAGVQRRIRQRSRGRFFADGWSTAQSRTSYMLVGLMTLSMVVLAYLALGPWAIR